MEGPTDGRDNYRERELCVEWLVKQGAKQTKDFMGKKPLDYAIPGSKIYKILGGSPCIPTQSSTNSTGPEEENNTRTDAKAPRIVSRYAQEMRSPLEPLLSDIEQNEIQRNAQRDYGTK